MTADARWIRPYGDTKDDGAVQLSFTLPLAGGSPAREAARRLCLAMGVDEPAVVHMQDLGSGHTFFIVYGRARPAVDLSAIHVTEVAAPVLDMAEVCAIVAADWGRRVVVVGACTGSDAHTVGLDAILGAKGYRGDYGLERYPCFATYNLGSQVSNEDLVSAARAHNADVLLVSQVVTQKNVHVTNLTRLVDLLEAEGLREQLLLICGGPRLSHELALELGFDAGFGRDTLPSQVASYIVTELRRRLPSVTSRPTHGDGVD